MHDSGMLSKKVIVCAASNEYDRSAPNVAVPEISTVPATDRAGQFADALAVRSAPFTQPPSNRQVPTRSPPHGGA